MAKLNAVLSELDISSNGLGAEGGKSVRPPARPRAQAASL
jgi:hypothetical protein